jgi:hypothetical protein
MARGGHRDNSGRKSSWASGCSIENTKLIRVPIAIADKVLESAHNIDAETLLDKVNLIKAIDNQELIERAKLIINDESFIRSKDRYKHRKAFARLLNIDESYFKS